MRVLLAGDVHGNDRFFEEVVRTAVAQRCEGIFQVGDWGYWEHYSEGKNFLDGVEELLIENEIWCWWIDGNHENHPMLWLNYGPGGNFYQPNDLGMYRVRDFLYYVPRGTRWEWDGLTCLALGGAYSVDKEYRREGTSWWATEKIRDEDMAKALEGGTVDLMFTHDCPDGVDIPSLRASDKNRFPESLDNRVRLRSVVTQVRPKLLVHGHYHCAYTDKLDFPYGDADGEIVWHRTWIEGLSADYDMEGNMLVMDTEHFKASATVQRDA